jgi:hypothetical protein
MVKGVIVVTKDVSVSMDEGNGGQKGMYRQADE